MTGSIFDFFERVRQAGYKMKLPLLEGGKSWCDKTSIHRVGRGHYFESTIEFGYSQGWTRMGNPPEENQWNQWTCPGLSVPKESTPENHDIAYVQVLNDPSISTYHRCNVEK